MNYYQFYHFKTFTNTTSYKINFLKGRHQLLEMCHVKGYHVSSYPRPLTYFVNRRLEDRNVYISGECILWDACISAPQQATPKHIAVCIVCVGLWKDSACIECYSPCNIYKVGWRDVVWRTMWNTQFFRENYRVVSVEFDHWVDYTSDETAWQVNIFMLFIDSLITRHGHIVYVLWNPQTVSALVDNILSTLSTQKGDNLSYVTR